MKSIYIFMFLHIFSGCNLGDTNSDPGEAIFLTKASLGEALFSDKSLSLDRTMSCSTCHNPDHAFIDSRNNVVDGATSMGQDSTSLGDRNTPTITYAKLIPSFKEVSGDFFGGQFADGRAVDLVEQAKGPFLNSIEMQMPTIESVVIRVIENKDYVASFEKLYDSSIFDNPDVAFDAIAAVITEFEKSDAISPFDSLFDTGTLNAQELNGKALFRSANCIRCHNDNAPKPTFTLNSYHNLGVPQNLVVRAINNHGQDEGLFGNANLTDVTKKGRFRVSTLRNIAVTAPYMHNGVFKELKTVVHFYNTRDVPGAINPETGLGWRAAEVSTDVVTNDVGDLGLTDSEEDDIVAFLKTLTDKRYEHLD
ncbi:MAG: c-type cytochrome [Halobacteriovoraceae bacterium]|nr:c-type cytochrome [Halobacteriovoraceae bacterium]